MSDTDLSRVRFHVDPQPPAAHPLLAPYVPRELAAIRNAVKTLDKERDERTAVRLSRTIGAGMLLWFLTVTVIAGLAGARLYSALPVVGATVFLIVLGIGLQFAWAIPLLRWLDRKEDREALAPVSRLKAYDAAARLLNEDIAASAKIIGSDSPTALSLRDGLLERLAMRRQEVEALADQVEDAAAAYQEEWTLDEQRRKEKAAATELAGVLKRVAEQRLRVTDPNSAYRPTQDVTGEVAVNLLRGDKS